jgi:hypothetical protein
VIRQANRYVPLNVPRIRLSNDSPEINSRNKLNKLTGKRRDHIFRQKPNRPFPFRGIQIKFGREINPSVSAQGIDQCIQEQGCLEQRVCGLKKGNSYLLPFY